MSLAGQENPNPPNHTPPLGGSAGMSGGGGHQTPPSGGSAGLSGGGGHHTPPSGGSAGLSGGGGHHTPPSGGSAGMSGGGGHHTPPSGGSEGLRGGGGLGLGIIRYGAGNIFSLTAALERLGIAYGMVNTEADLDKFDRYIIPGVGHAGAAMQKLQQTGLVPAIKALNKPTLGICVGMQLLTSYSEEGDSDLLSIFPIKTLKFTSDPGHKVPHTGWNRVFPEKENPLFKNIPNGSHFYFVHSYFIEYDNAFTLAATDYSTKFSASIWLNNFYGVQFHPEKSGEYGEILLSNFSKI